jgi:isoleucyl-tRNA synthetase
MGDDKSPEGKLFNQNFPADFIAEAVDQTRGWFYTMLILSVGLFDRAAFKCVNTTGLILAEDGQKMSKKLKNYPDPMTIAPKYGADAIRFYMVASPVVRGEELRFATSGVDEVFKKIILRTGNVLLFLEMYGTGKTILRTAPVSTNVLDQWIIARFNETLAEVTKNLDTHELDYATRPMPKFVDDLSTWYLRRSRDRFKSDDVADMEAVRQTTSWCSSPLRV